jgi:hypothetical protein
MLRLMTREMNVVVDTSNAFAGFNSFVSFDTARILHSTVDSFLCAP